ncbi:uncharacterized protein RHOBADRAFT_37989 [Rhodotorula graminis WP1]|uniref:Sphingomyelin phosphodiesterase n=1 Tax=Rhodotorula graminis (strain WP1) TaxID=578459 RepID=A0A0P9FEA1_RHOGW|nr:uncharacterized protein RHOBADRAFT_37989 [Rhodotorula graminis WP1]KPV74114.1 hypothetical protein RHOBADRAFT_37989 [Rhodotorula graminis WP1]
MEYTGSCAACLALLGPMKQFAEMGDQGFVDLATGFCSTLGIQDADVCAGAVGTQAPILAHVLRSVGPSSLALNSFCASIFGLCPLPDTTPHKVNLSDPPFSLSSASSSEILPEQTAPFQVVHISDTHVDREYTVGADADCRKVICCRNYGPQSVGAHARKPAGPYGADKCDSPPALVDSVFQAVEQFAPNRSFTIFTGDAMDDAVWESYRPKIEREMHSWHASLPTRSYPVFGNHDVAPVNGFPRSTALNASSVDWVYELAARDWEKWVGRAAAEQVRTMSGCYATVHPGTSLKIISLNTNLWYKQNFWLYDSDAPVWDPNGILTWLARELDEAEQAGQRAWIIGHMSFGKTDTLRDQSNYAGQIFQRYHRTIAAHFYGHSHRDEFEIGYSDYSDRSPATATAISFIGGALTPASGNPVFRVYDVDPDTYEVVDFVPIIANRSSSTYQAGPEWARYYSARESYGAFLDPPHPAREPLNARFWHRLTEAFEVNESAFQLYLTRTLRGHPTSATKCDTPSCKAAKLCALRSMRSEDNCVRPSRLSALERRSY